MKNGGEDGIRTHETLLRSTPLAGERLRPLGHLSGRGAIARYNREFKHFTSQKRKKLLHQHIEIKKQQIFDKFTALAINYGAVECLYICANEAKQQNQIRLKHRI